MRSSVSELACGSDISVGNVGIDCAKMATIVTLMITYIKIELFFRYIILVYVR